MNLLKIWLSVEEEILRNYENNLYRNQGMKRNKGIQEISEDESIFGRNSKNNLFKKVEMRLNHSMNESVQSNMEKEDFGVNVVESDLMGNDIHNDIHNDIDQVIGGKKLKMNSNGSIGENESKNVVKTNLFRRGKSFPPPTTASITDIKSSSLNVSEIRFSKKPTTKKYARKKKSQTQKLKQNELKIEDFSIDIFDPSLIENIEKRIVKEVKFLKEQKKRVRMAGQTKMNVTV